MSSNKKGVQNLNQSESEEIEYLTGKDYPDLCDNCKRSIDDAHELIVMGFVSEDYVIDNEGPSMLAYDKRWTCIDDCEVD